MYIQFRELESEEPYLEETLKRMREQRGDAPIAVGVYVEDPKKLGIALIDLPEIPWTMAGSPITVFMQNELWSKPETQEAMERMFKDFPTGDYHLTDLGVDHSNLLMGKYDWGEDLNKVKNFFMKVENKEYLIDIKDHEGNKCFGCAFLSSYGCGMDGGGCHHQIDGCLHEAVALIEEEEIYDDEDYYHPYD